MRFQLVVGHTCAEQFGFMKDRCTLDACFILDTVIDDAIARGDCIYAAFIDFKKAYDFVPREALFFKMLHANMYGPVLKVLYSMYKAVYSVVQVGLDRSDVISQLVGVRQGCILSPCLFSFYIADFPSYLANRTGNERCVGVTLHDTVLHVLMYADDMVLLATSPEDLQRMFDALREYCSTWRMFVNVEKTKVVIFHKDVSAARSVNEREQLRQLHVTLHTTCAFTYTIV